MFLFSRQKSKPTNCEEYDQVNREHILCEDYHIQLLYHYHCHFLFVEYSIILESVVSGHDGWVNGVRWKKSTMKGIHVSKYACVIYAPTFQPQEIFYFIFTNVANVIKLIIIHKAVRFLRSNDSRVLNVTRSNTKR